MTTDFHVKYRPTDFDQVIGQDLIVKSLRNVLSKRPPHTYLFTGPSGVGKTTLARIVASELGCDSFNTMEIDAASHTGIDAMRAVVDSIRYLPFGDSSARAIIIDEAHALSKAAVQSLYKVLEEPPDHAYWMLCTTEPDRIPQPIKTRALQYELSYVDRDEIFELLKFVCKQEKLKTDPSILDMICDHSGGSPRQALVYLVMCSGCDSRKEAARIIKQGADAPEMAALLKMLRTGQGLTWGRIIKCVDSMQFDNPESIRLKILDYFTKVLLGVEDQKKAARYLSILDAFSEPFSQQEKMAPLLLALGRIVYEEEQ